MKHPLKYADQERAWWIIENNMSMSRLYPETPHMKQKRLKQESNKNK